MEETRQKYLLPNGGCGIRTRVLLSREGLRTSQLGYHVIQNVTIKPTNTTKLLFT